MGKLKCQKMVEGKSIRFELTVEPPVSGHPRDQKKCPFKRGVRLWEVKNVLFV